MSKDEDFVINWVFLNISKTDERKKILTVMYSGDVANCRDQSSNLEPLSEASMDSGNTISCGINLDRLGNLSKIYFCATATVQGSIIANIEGILDIKNKGMYLSVHHIS